MMVSGEQIAALMNQKGPIVQCVMLRADGRVEEVTVDMTPKRNAMVELFGGQPSIIGQYPILDTVLMKRLESEEDEGLQKNTHRLPHPLHEEEHLGDLLLIRMNKESEPESFTKKEWTEFLKKAPFTEEAYKAWKEEHGLDEEEDEDEDDEEMEINALLDIFTQNFRQEHGREPTEEELEEMKESLMNAAAEADDGEGLTEEEEELLEKTVAALEKKLKREPTDDEVEGALSKIEGGDEIIRKMQANQGEEDDEDDENQLDEAEEELLDEIATNLMSQKKREPTKEEMVAALSKTGEIGEQIIAKLEALEAAAEEDDEAQEEDDGEEDDDEDDDEVVEDLGEDEDDDEDSEDPLNEEEREILNTLVTDLSKRLKRIPEEDEIREALLKKKGGAEIIAKLDSMGDDEEEDEDEDEAEDPLTPAQRELLQSVVDELEAKLKREPQDEEIMKVLAKKPGGDVIIELLMGMDEDEEEEEDEGEDPLEPGERAVVVKVMDALTLKLKREPEDEELMQELIKKPGGREIVQKLLDATADDEDEEDDEEDPLDDSERDALSKVLEGLEKKLKRDPTQDEIVQALLKTEVGQAIVSKWMGDDEEDEEDEEEDEDDDDEDDEDEEEEEEKAPVQRMPKPQQPNKSQQQHQQQRKPQQQSQGQRQQNGNGQQRGPGQGQRPQNGHGQQSHGQGQQHRHHGHGHGNKHAGGGRPRGGGPPPKRQRRG